MNQMNLSGFLLIAGFIVVLLASFVGPPRLYQESDSNQQLEIIKTHWSRWIASNVLFILGGLATAVGLILFSLSIRGEVNSLLNWLAMISYSLGTVLWIFYLYNRTVNPAQLFEDYVFSPLTIALVGFLLSGMLLFGILYFQTGYPNWLSFGTVGLTVLIGGLAIIFPAQFFKSFPPQVLYLFTLAAGIVFLRHN